MQRVVSSSVLAARLRTGWSITRQSDSSHLLLERSAGQSRLRVHEQEELVAQSNSALHRPAKPRVAVSRVRYDLACGSKAPFAVVWANQSTADVHLTTVLDDGRVGADLSVTPPESNTFDPTVATSPRGFLVVYTAVADERPLAGTQRLFAEVILPVADAGA